MSRKPGRARGRRRAASRELVKAALPRPDGMGSAELSRTGARSTTASTTSLVDAVQTMTRAGLTESGVYAPTRDLPRDPLDLSPFGPLAPLLIQAINPPRADTGRPEPRVWEYPQGFNLPGGSDRLIGWDVLRAAASNVDIIRRCIEIRKDDISALSWAWQVSEDAIKAAQVREPTRPRDEIEAELRERYAEDIERLTAMWERPWITNGVRFRQWVAAVMEDHIALDAVAVYPVTSVNGEVIAFRLVDGATIKLLINDLGERPQPPFAAFQQVVHGFPRGEFIADVVLNEDGTEDDSTKFTASQLTYWRENFRTFTPYGLSQVEQALISAALYLKRQGWMHAEYDEGSTPLTWLVPQVDKFTVSQLGPAQRREYETAINDDLEGQTGKRHRIKVSYPGFTPMQMDSVEERYKPEYDLHLIKLVASHLGVTLDRLGFTETKGLGATGQHERQAEVQDDSGVNPDAKMLTDLIHELSRNYLNAPPELAFVFSADKVEDEAAKDSILDAQRKRGTITMNDDRKRSGYQPLDVPEADMPSMVTATGIVYIEGGAEQQAAMNELALNPPAPGGATSGPSRPSGGTGGGTGGSRPKPSGPKPASSSGAARSKAAAAVEVTAYRRWLAKSKDGVPRRPFHFEHAEPTDLVANGHELDGALQTFDGYEWRVEIIKGDWRAWNAANPAHPRGPNGRFVRASSLLQALQDMGEVNENALDEAVGRLQAGRPVRRGESPQIDRLHISGLLEDAPEGKGRLQLSERGRQHLVSRMPDAYTDASVVEASGADVNGQVNDLSSTIEGMTTPDKPITPRELPVLRGTLKQREWAQQIRDRALRTLTSYEPARVGRTEAGRAVEDEIFRRIVAEHDDARWWIDNRDNVLRALRRDISDADRVSITATDNASGQRPIGPGGTMVEEGLVKPAGEARELTPAERASVIFGTDRSRWPERTRVEVEALERGETIAPAESPSPNPKRSWRAEVAAREDMTTPTPKPVKLNAGQEKNLRLIAEQDGNPGGKTVNEALLRRGLVERVPGRGNEANPIYRVTDVGRAHLAANSAPTVRDLTDAPMPQRAATLEPIKLTPTRERSLIEINRRAETGRHAVNAAGQPGIHGRAIDALRSAGLVEYVPGQAPETHPWNGKLQLTDAGRAYLVAHLAGMGAVAPEADAPLDILAIAETVYQLMNKPTMGLRGYASNLVDDKRMADVAQHLGLHVPADRTAREVVMDHVLRERGRAFSASLPKIDSEGIRARLAAAPSRQAAMEYLDDLDLKSTEMRALARELAVHAPSGATKDRMRDAIVNALVSPGNASGASAAAESTALGVPMTPAAARAAARVQRLAARSSARASGSVSGTDHQEALNAMDSPDDAEAYVRNIPTAQLRQMLKDRGLKISSGMSRGQLEGLAVRSVRQRSYREAVRTTFDGETRAGGA